MNTRLLILLFFLTNLCATAQTKVSGYVFDEFDYPVSFANVVFKGSSVGVITNEDGRFYLEDDNNWDTLSVSFMSYQTEEIKLEKKVSFDLKVILKEEVAALDEVFIVSGRQPKKNNPAIDILRKIWKNKRTNGLKKYNQYQYDKYEKVEFDLNTIDSSLMKSKMFKGMEFVFDQVDTSSVTGKTYLPIFINEASSKVYGDNITKAKRDVLKGNRNSGFSNNQMIIDFVDDLYSDYDIYKNYIKLFDKSFTSPISRSGIQTYNYVLADSSYIDNKWCYNIIYYPRRKNELTFKGDFWVADTTYAIKDINMQASKSANINWVKEIYIEQEFDVVNDSVFLMKRDYFMSDFAFQAKEASKGIYGKRTTLYDNYKFDEEKDPKFYKEKVISFDEDLYNQDDEFWDKNRMETLSKDEKGVYVMLDSLKQTKKFKRLYNVGSILASGYINFPSLNFDYGPILSTVGYNVVEGFRLRTGGRTYFGQNDLWRLEGYAAYGFKDNKVKYGISGKWLVDKRSRLILSAGNRRDVEQIGASLTTSTDVFGRSLASNAVVGTGTNDKLTNVNLTSVAVEAEPFRNVITRLSGTYRTLESASPTFSLDYYTDATQTTTESEVKQFETNFSLSYFPNREMTGYGVERRKKNSNYPRLFAQVSVGDKSILDSDFDYTKVQFSYTQPWSLGGFGRLFTTIEAGKTFGKVPLGLLSVVPGNQSYFAVKNTFSNLNFYEFVADEYLAMEVEHNFNGRLFSLIPLLKKYNLRTIIGARGVMGDVSQENRDINASGLLYVAPNKEAYYEYSIGVGNIFKVFRLDYNIRGNYLDPKANPEARRHSINLSFGFYF